MLSHPDEIAHVVPTVHWLKELATEMGAANELNETEIVVDEIEMEVMARQRRSKLRNLRRMQSQNFVQRRVTDVVQLFTHRNVA